MKTTLFMIMLLVASVATAQDSQNNKENDKTEKQGLARVQKLRGIEVYVMSEPLREYIVVETVSSAYTATASMPIPTIVGNYLHRAEKKKEDGIQFDALLINDSKGVLIKWKD